MLKVKRKHVYGIILIGILCIAACIRLEYIRYAGGSVILEPDSQGYYVEKNFFTDDLLHNFFNTNRTPGYTMLTSLAMDATVHAHPVYKSPEFFSGTWIVIVVQTILGLAGLIVLYDILLSLGISPVPALAFTGFTAVNIYQFIWERAVLTEALYIFLLTVLLRIFVSLLKKPSPGHGLLFTVISAYAFELRPAGLFLPFILLPVVWLMHRTKKVFILAAIALALYTSVPILHLAMNKSLYNFKGLSINTDFAVFGRILHYNIPVESAKSVEPLYGEVVSYRAAGGNVTIPWYFFVYYNNEIYSHMDDLQAFDRLVLSKHLPEFTATVIGDIPKAFSDTYVEEVLYRSPVPGAARTFFDGLTLLVTSLQKTTIVFLLLFPFTVYLFIKKQSVLRAFLLGIGVLELYQLVSTLLFGGAWEYARHMITSQTYLFLFCFWWAGYLLTAIRKRMVQ